MKITAEIREQVLRWLEQDFDPDDDNFYSFYYRCMQADMDPGDADRYAILNTLFQYDIGMHNAREIDNWFYEHDEEIFELNGTEKDKQLVKRAVEERGLHLDFSNWIHEYKDYDFFEEA